MFTVKAKNISCILFGVSVLFTAVCRIYQSLRPSEVLSSFFSSEFFCFLASVVCYVAIGLILKFSQKNGELEDFEFTIRKNYVVAAVSSILGLAVFTNGFVILSKYISGFRSASPFFEGVFAVLAGAVFVLTGVSFGLGKNFFKNNELLLLCPVAWGASRSLNVFLSYNMVSNVAWNLADVLATIFISLFLLNHAKCIARREDVKEVGHTFWYGFSAFMFIFIYTTRSVISRGKDFLSLAPGNNGIIEVVSSVWVVDALMALYVLSMLFLGVSEKNGVKA